MIQASTPRSQKLRISALIVCLLAAFSAALFQKESESEKNPAQSKSPVLSPEDVLSSIPNSVAATSTDDALEKAKEFARNHPQDSIGWIHLGDLLAQKLRDTADHNYLTAAESAYQRALFLDPEALSAMTGMAWVTGTKHTFDESTNWAKRVLEIDPENADAFGILGDAEVELGDYEAAFDHYQSMMDLRPDLSSWSRGAHLVWLTGDRSKSVWLMEKAIRAGAPHAENTAWCRANLAMMHFNNGALLPAVNSLSPALKSAPNNVHVLLAAARISTAQGDHQKAASHYHTILRQGENHEALVGLGDLLMSQGDPKAAESYYSRVEELHNAHSAAASHDHMAMAKFFADHDRNLIQAMRLAEQHKLTKNVREADVLAWVYLKNGHLEKAVATMKRALAQSTPDPEMHFHAGMIAAAAGDRSAARKHLQKALSLNPRFHPLHAPEAHRTLDSINLTSAITTRDQQR